MIKFLVVVPVIIPRRSGEPLEFTDFIPDSIEPYVLKIINYEIFGVPVWQIILLIAVINLIIRCVKLLIER